MVPICTCGHWILLVSIATHVIIIIVNIVIMQVLHPKEGTMRVYDSINGSYPECVDRMRKWLSFRCDVLWTLSYATKVMKV